jgi:hypothetical protein
LFGGGGLTTMNSAAQAAALMTSSEMISLLMRVLPVYLVITVEKGGNSVSLSPFYDVVKLNFG